MALFLNNKRAYIMDALLCLVFEMRAINALGFTTNQINQDHAKMMIMG